MRLRRVLLICGIVSSLLYVGIDLLAALRHGGYHSFVTQTISELGARGAPTKPLVDPLFIGYDLLLIAFGAGVWRSAGEGHALRLIAASLIGIGVLGLPAPWLFPMNLRGSGNVSADLPHVVGTGVMLLFIMTAIVSGTRTQGRWFRLYSFATLLSILVTGVLTSVEALGMANGQPTPTIGLMERANIGAFLLWVAVLALSLLRAGSRLARMQSRAGVAIPTGKIQSAGA